MFQPDPKKEPRPKKLPKPIAKFSKKRLQQIARNELPVKIKKPIRKVSEKQKEQLAIYSKLRKQKLIDNPNCELRIQGICLGRASEIDHADGRGINLNNVDRMKSVCRPCHNFRHLNNLKYD